MFRSAMVRWLMAFVVFVAVISLLRFKPWQRHDGDQGASSADRREMLKVGFLPVTCHLTCPVTDFASKASKSTRFESQRFTDFPTMAESIKAGRIQASFMIAPLAMKIEGGGCSGEDLVLGTPGRFRSDGAEE